MGKSKPSQKTKHWREFRKSGVDLSCSKRNFFIAFSIAIAVSLGLVIYYVYLQQLEDLIGETPPSASSSSASAKFDVQKKAAVVQEGYMDVCTDCVRQVNSFGELLSDVGSEPLLIRNHGILKKWSIFDLDLLDIAKNAPNFTLEMSRWSTEPVFVLGHEREKGGMIGSTKEQPVRYTHITLYDFLGSAFDPKDWFYWTGELSIWEEIFEKRFTWDTVSSLGGAFNDGWKDFISLESGILFNGRAETDAESKKMRNSGSAKYGRVDDGIGKEEGGVIEEEENTAEDDTLVSAAHNIDYSLWHPMLWLSHPSVVAQTHFDTQHNVFIQVQGYKRFLLFPPDTELYSYPNIHRSYRQSQVHFENEFKAEQHHAMFPLVNKTVTKAYEVNLSPGDVMYIPPFWHHRVESTTLSLSLSVLSPSSVEARFAQVYWEYLPIGDMQSTRGLRSAAVIQYLTQFYDHFVHLLKLVDQAEQSPEYEQGIDIMFGESFGAFSKSLYDSRFAPLLYYPASSTNANDNFDRRRRVKKEEERVAAMLNEELLSYWKHANITENLPKLRSAAINVSAMLHEIPQSVASLAVKRTFLRDYFEQIVRWAVGPQHTGTFIGHCMSVHQEEQFSLVDDETLPKSSSSSSSSADAPTATDSDSSSISRKTNEL